MKQTKQKITTLLRKKLYRFPVWSLVLVGLAILSAPVVAQFVGDFIISFTGTTPANVVTGSSPLTVNALNVTPCNSPNWPSPCSPILVEGPSGSAAVNVNAAGVTASWTIITDTTGPAPSAIGLIPSAGTCPGAPPALSIPQDPSTVSVPAGAYDYCLYYASIPSSSPLDSVDIEYTG